MTETNSFWHQNWKKVTAIIAGSFVLLAILYIAASHHYKNAVIAKREELRQKYIQPLELQESEEAPEKYLEKASLKILEVMGHDFESLGFMHQFSKHKHLLELGPEEVADLTYSQENTLRLLKESYSNYKQKLIKSEADIIALLDKADSLTQYTTNPNSTYRMNLPDNPSSRIKEYLYFGAYVFAKDNPKKAISFISRLLENNQHYFRYNPNEHLRLYNSFHFRGISALIHLLEHSELDTNTLTRLRNIANYNFDIETFKAAFTIKCVSFFENIDNPKALVYLPDRQYIPSIYSNSNELRAYELMIESFDLLGPDMYKKYLYRDFVLPLDIYITNSNRQLPPRPTINCMPAIRGRLRISCHRLAFASASITAIDVMRAKIKLGRLPKDVAEIESTLNVKIPNDPYSNSKLIYKITGSGFKVYSVGVDHGDDGGEIPYDVVSEIKLNTHEATDE